MKKGIEPCFHEYERIMPEDAHAYGEWVEGGYGPAASAQDNLGDISWERIQACVHCTLQVSLHE